MLKALLHRPRKPTVQVPVVFTIGWWPHQKCISLQNFDVSIIDSKLNVANSTSLVQYAVRGTLQHQTGYKPYIKSIHIVEEIIQEPSVEEGVFPIMRVKITPIVDVKKSKYDGAMIPFSFHNEHTIQSMGWGPNIIRFECSTFIKSLTLQQSK